LTEETVSIHHFAVK